ncbi:MAG: cupin domain-containing protein [candidate division Zixibacteria bacterium]|nr:cupin domain-containing protein [candidate division Zixibacteria bacterium]
MPKVNLLKEGKKIKVPFKPLPVCKVGSSNILVGIIKGEYKKHKHPYDEFFYILDGKIVLELEKEKVSLSKGEGILVKKGEEHRTSSRHKSLVMLFERCGMESQFTE